MATHISKWVTGLPSASRSVTADICAAGARASGASGAYVGATVWRATTEPAGMAVGEKASAETAKRAKTTLYIMIF